MAVPKQFTAHISGEIKQEIFDRIQRGEKINDVALSIGESSTIVRSIYVSMAQYRVRENDKDGWRLAVVEKVIAMHRNGIPLGDIAKAVTKSKVSVYKKLVREGVIVPDSAKNPVTLGKIRTGGQTAERPYPAERYLRDDGEPVFRPLPAGHPTTWGLISDKPYHKGG